MEAQQLGKCVLSKLELGGEPPSGCRNSKCMSQHTSQHQVQPVEAAAAAGCGKADEQAPGEAILSRSQTCQMKSTPMNCGN